jgi:hypothetical protein
MNSTLSLARRPRAVRPTAPILPRPDLTWIHDGTRYRVTVWPDILFQRESAPGKWVQAELGEMAFASAALGVTSPQWRRFLEFMPPAERECLERFQFGRMAVLNLITRCPGLVTQVTQVPALATFLAAHASLRTGDDVARWAEINAVFERDGIFGLLQWLGLPASPQTLAILRNVEDPDLPRRLLEPLRAALWEPEAIWALSHAPALTDERLAEACHALAA